MDPDAANLIYAALNIDIPIHPNQKEINMCQAVEEWKQELLDEGYANGERDGYANGERDGIDKEKHNIAQNMILMDCFKYEDISRVTGLSIDRIHEIKETM